MSSKTYLFIGAGVVLAFLIGYYIWKRYNTPKAMQVAEDKTPKVDQPQAQPSPASKEQGTIYELSGDDVPSILAKEKNVVIMVYKPSCGYCHKMAPELDKAAVKYHGCTWSRLNGEAFPQAIQHLKANISGFPTIIHYMNGQPVNVLVGYRPCDQLLQEVQSKQ